MPRERKFHSMFQGGERIRRRLAETTVISKNNEHIYGRPDQRRQIGTVAGPAVERGGSRGAWYLPVHWDGVPEDRVEWIHINRISLLEGVHDAR